MRTWVVVAASTLAAAAPVAAQVGVAAHAGSLGLGVDVGFGLTGALGARLGANVQPWRLDATVSDVVIRGTPATPAFTGFIDLHPFPGGFRVTGGAVYFAGSHELVGTPEGPVEVGGVTYDASLVGSLSATLETRSLAPYLGLGWGGAARSGLGLSVDLGVAFQGDPQVAMDVAGPLSVDPEFRAAFDREVADFEDDISMFRLYPVLSVGVSFARR